MDRSRISGGPVNPLWWGYPGALRARPPFLGTAGGSVGPAVLCWAGEASDGFTLFHIIPVRCQSIAENIICKLC